MATYDEQQARLRALVPQGTAGARELTGQGFSDVGSNAPDLSGLPPEWVILYNQLQEYLTKLQERGERINPNIEITPQQVAEFTKKAEGEIDPYFGSQLKLARESFMRDWKSVVGGKRVELGG